MPNRKTKGRKHRGSASLTRVRRQNQYTNTIITSFRTSTLSKITWQQLLNLSARLCVLMNIKVEVLPGNIGTTPPTTFNPVTATMQVGVQGPAWTGDSSGDFVPSGPAKILSLVNPTRFNIGPFYPGMRTPIDSDNTAHILVLNADRFGASTEAINCRITTTVKLVPQTDIRLVTSSPV